MKIITALRVELSEGAQARAWAKGTDNLEAYLKVLKAREYFQHMNKDDNEQARRLLKEIIALDPQYPYPYTLLGWTHWMDIWYRTSKSPPQSIARAFELANKAIALDSSEAAAYACLSMIYLYKRQYEKAIAVAERSVEVDPNFANGYCFLARSLHHDGRSDESIALYKKAMRLNPIPPSFYYYQLGQSFIMTGAYQEAVAEINKAIEREPNNLIAYISLAAAYGLLGRVEDARMAAKEVVRLNPNFSVNYWAKHLPYKKEADKQRFATGLLRAGLPE